LGSMLAVEEERRERAEGGVCMLVLLRYSKSLGIWWASAGM
jgi:hypothetical protein